MLKALPISKKADFQQMAKSGKKIYFFCGKLVYFKRSNDEISNQNIIPNCIRVAYAVSKKVIGCAVSRNRVKRRLKAAVAACLKTSETPRGTTYILIIPNTKALDADFKELSESLRKVVDVAMSESMRS